MKVVVSKFKWAVQGPNIRSEWLRVILNCYLGNKPVEREKRFWKKWLIWKDPDAGKDWGQGGKGDIRGWDGWMASLTQWTWVWVDSGSWWWTGRPGVLRFLGSQRVGHDWATELNWTELGGNILLVFLVVCFKFILLRCSWFGMLCWFLL